MKLFDKKIALFLDQAVVSLANFTIGILLVRKSGLAEFGIFSLHWIAALFLAGISFSYIISPLLTNYYKKNEKARRVYLEHVYTLLLFFCIALLLCGTLVSSASGNVYFGGALFCVVYVLYDGSRKLKYLLEKHIQVLVLDMFVYALVIGFAFYSYSTIEEFFLVFAISMFIFCITELHIVRRFNIKYFFLFINYQHKHGRWLLYNNFSQWFNEPFYFTISGYFVGPSAVGAIRIVQNFFGMCNVFIIFLESYLPIYLSKVRGASKQLAYNKLAKAFLFISSVVCIFVAVLGGVFGHDLIEYIYKDTSDNSVLYIFAYSVSYFFIINILVFKVILRNEGESKTIFESFTIVAFVNVLISLPLIHFFGEIGVVFGICLGWLLTFAFLYEKCRSHFVK